MALQFPALTSAQSFDFGTLSPRSVVAPAPKNIRWSFKAIGSRLVALVVPNLKAVKVDFELTDNPDLARCLAEGIQAPLFSTGGISLVDGNKPNCTCDLTLWTPVAACW